MSEKRPFKTRPGVIPEIQINVLDYLPRERLLLALKRIRGLIAEGIKFTAYDDDPDCSFGLCSHDKRAWPDAQDHIFPLDFIEHGRISALSTVQKNSCPLDARCGRTTGRMEDLQGCYHSCLVFRPKKGQQPMTREWALARYDARIAKLERSK